MSLLLIGIAILLIALAAGGAIAFIVMRSYIARTERTFMTHNEHGFKRALKGRGVLWDVEESVVKGPEAPRIEFVALDPTTGKRRAGQLLDPKTGSINLRPQYCVPLPFHAATADGHRLLVEARVQFSLNRDLLKYVYQLEDFSLALETRIQSAFRAEIGRRKDEDLRAGLHEVEEQAIARLRQAERDGDEAGEAGVALGVNFHTASFTYSMADETTDPILLSAQHSAAMQAAPAPGEYAAPAHAHLPAPAFGRAPPRHQSLLSLKPQQLDLLADVFKGRPPESLHAILAIMEMQTRQNIAESLAASGQTIVVTAEEIGLTGAGVQRDAILQARHPAPPPAPAAAPTPPKA